MKNINLLFSILVLLNLIKKRFSALAFCYTRPMCTILYDTLILYERWFLFFVYYTELCTGCSIKNQLIASFGEQFKKSHENLKIIFSLMLVILIKKYSKFSYCYTGQGAGCSTKEAKTASFVKHFKENLTVVYFAVVI